MLLTRGASSIFMSLVVLGAARDFCIWRSISLLLLLLNPAVLVVHESWGLITTIWWRFLCQSYTSLGSSCACEVLAPLSKSFSRHRCIVSNLSTSLRWLLRLVRFGWNRHICHILWGNRSYGIQSHSLSVILGAHNLHRLLLLSLMGTLSLLFTALELLEALHDGTVW